MYYDAIKTGNRIKELRIKRDMTQDELCKRLNLSPRQIRRVESGQTVMTIDLFVEISQLFKVSLDYLAFGTNFDEDDRNHKIRLAAKILCEVVGTLD